MVSQETRVEAGKPMVRAGPRFEVADVFRLHLGAYQGTHALDRGGTRVARDLMACRTAALGGHMEHCESCGFDRPAYNSCRNRHCPKCQALSAARWVAQRLDRVLPTHHFHVVFTLPADLHEVALRNPRRVYDLILKSAVATLLALGRDPKWLGQAAELGVTAVLHTWARDLRLHPHVHCIVTGGGLSQDGATWVSARQDFIFPVHVLGALFRGKVLAGLGRLRQQGLLHDQPDDRAARRRRGRLGQQSWVVYAKRPFGGARQVFEYLGRYTHRVAISNHRLLDHDHRQITFRTRGEATVTLHPWEFMRRFLLHVLPRGFVKIRHGGLLAPTRVKGPLACARKCLEKRQPRPTAAEPGGAAEADVDAVTDSDSDPDWITRLDRLTQIDVTVCSRCGCRAVVRLPLPAVPRAPPPPSRKKA